MHKYCFVNTSPEIYDYFFIFQQRELQIKKAIGSSIRYSTRLSVPNTDVRNGLPLSILNLLLSSEIFVAVEYIAVNLNHLYNNGFGGISKSRPI
jgi:hypothetical protein